MWDIKHKSGTLLFTTCDESVADNRRTMGWVVEMKKLTVEKAQELIEQLSQRERSCREEYYLQALEAFVGDQWIACSDRMPDINQDVLCVDEHGYYEAAQYVQDCLYKGDPFFSTTSGAFYPTQWRPL